MGATVMSVASLQIVFSYKPVICYICKLLNVISVSYYVCCDWLI